MNVHSRQAKPKRRASIGQPASESKWIHSIRPPGFQQEDKQLFCAVLNGAEIPVRYSIKTHLPEECRAKPPKRRILWIFFNQRADTAHRIVPKPDEGIG